MTLSSMLGDLVPLQLVLGTVLVASASVIWTQVVQPLYAARKLSLPPGPPGHWLFGNASPGPYSFRYYSELVDTYGPVISLRYGKRIVCVIGRYQAAVDILSKHSAETADRPRAIAANEIQSGGMRVLMTQAGERIKKIRRALHAYLQPNVAENYKQMQYKNAKKYILDCYLNPAGHLKHAKRYAASVVMTIAYGKTTPTSYSDPEVQAVNKYLALLGATLRPGAHLVDTYPFLRYIPGYLAHLRRYQAEEQALYSAQLDVVRKQLAHGDVQPSFATYLLENQERLQFSDAELAYLAGAIFGAGSDTTAAALGFITMAAACYPEAQARVQAQLDKVLGRDRVPSFEDEDTLPEVTAFVLEAYRWRPVSITGFAHRAMKDIIWKDYVIPEGAEILGIHWAIARDPDVYPEPEAFKPERWLTPDGCIRDDLRFFNFGFGRRVCVGQHVANNSLFINTALVLWAFKISQDPSKPIDTHAFTDTANVHPAPFHAIFEPRISNLEELLTGNDE
ncbi:cytochrome P450 [Wolfiporia cocos MD-104 SS10]|uniref:Cytochrome P450 n=1 Tax=Wolfiporia cocos (strain MD-104) TaxID=742152 RepID=A0A2H3JI52_WOLCO|nr:cytochrome P450 [Wolfiporia cocos MD-104 SS10]